MDCKALLEKYLQKVNEELKDSDKFNVEIGYREALLDIIYMLKRDIQVLSGIHSDGD